jgi:tetratricopeptide (TPR) repeat protein
LLERLDAQGRFHRLPDRETAQGLIFYDEERGEHVRVGHPVIAEVASIFYEEVRAPAAVLREIVVAVDASNHLERRFIAWLFRANARAKSSALHAVLSQLKETIAQYQQSASTISELCIWRAFYRDLGEQYSANCCVEAALKLTPSDPIDCELLLNLYRERGQECDALPMLAEWVRRHPEFAQGRPAYLYLVRRYGTEEEQDSAISETRDWLEKHPDDTSVRTAYLGLAERQGTPEQVKRVVQETRDWLEKHPGDHEVRKCYLGLAERQGTPEQVERVVQETRDWLEKHGTAKGAKAVWEALIALLVRSDNRTEEAAEVALKAISHHPNDRNLIANYLRFFDSSEDEQVVRKFYERLMAAYPRDNNIPAYFAAWLRDHNHQDKAHVIYNSLIHKAPHNFGARYGYGRLLLNLEEYEKAAEQFREALRIHKGHQMAHDGLAQALCGIGKLADQKGRVEEANQHFMEAEREFHQALYWADAQEKSQAIFYTHLGWFYIDRGSYPEALEAFNADFHGAKLCNIAG